MKVTTVVLAAALCASACVERSHAQPILNRVEQFLRDQVDAARNLPPQPASREPGYLGVTADDRQDAGRGVRIVQVAADGPAAQAGLQNGDLVVAIDGQPIRTMDDMAQALDQKVSGTRLTFTVERSGQSRQFQVALGRKPQSRPQPTAPETLPPPSAPPQSAAPRNVPGPNGPAPSTAAPRPRLGVRTLAVSEEVRLQNKLPDTRGAAVIAVSPDSPAARAGIPVGAVISAVDERRVDSPQTLASAISQAGGEVTLAYFEQGREQRRQVTLDVPASAADEPRLQLRGRPVAPPPAPTVAARARGQAGALRARTGGSTRLGP